MPCHMHETEKTFDSGNQEHVFFRDEFLKERDSFAGECPDICEGRGIITCAGGLRYFPPAYVTISLLRKTLGCTLPIEVWYCGQGELLPCMEDAAEELDFRLCDTHALCEEAGLRVPAGGWESKIKAVRLSAFRELLFLDGDNIPVRDPSFLFDSQQYLEKGAVFWPDYKRFSTTRSVWRLFSTPYVDAYEFESGQFVINKEKCWKEVCLTEWVNDHSWFYYNHMWGDKDTFNMVWRSCGGSFHFIRSPVEPLNGSRTTMLQRDFDGEPLFQHRNQDKFSVLLQNQRVPGFQWEDECFGYLRDFTDRFSEYLSQEDPEKRPAEVLLKELREQENRVNAPLYPDRLKSKFYRMCKVGFMHFGYKGSHERNLLELGDDGVVKGGESRGIHRWRMELEKGFPWIVLCSEKHREVARLKEFDFSVWKGTMSDGSGYTAELRKR